MTYRLRVSHISFVLIYLLPYLSICMWKEGSRTYFFYYIYSSSSGCHNNEVKSFLMSHHIFNITRASVKTLMNYERPKFRHFWPLTLLHNFITANRQKLPLPSTIWFFCTIQDIFFVKCDLLLTFKKKPKTSHFVNLIEDWSEIRIPELKFTRKKTVEVLFLKPEFSSQVIII